MATKRIPILGFTTTGDGTGECWMESYTLLATNDVWKHNVLRFGAANNAQPTVRHGIYGSFMVPKDYVGTAKIVIVWTATVTSGNVVWDFDYRTVGGDDTTSLDQAGTEEAVTVTDAAPGAANRKLEVTVNLTSANLAADEIVTFGLFRDGVDASDTMAASAMLFWAGLEYADV